MSETINTTIYNDNIQSLTSNNITLYTNKLNGQITLGNSNVNVSMNNVSLNNLTVNNIDNITTINVSSLTVNNIICNQPNETKFYFNISPTNTITTTNTGTTSSIFTLPIDTNANPILDFTINGSILKNFKNSILSTNIYASVSPDISSTVQYYFDISRNGVSILTSNRCDDLNDLSLNNVADPSLCICTVFTDNSLNNVQDGEIYTIRLSFSIIPINVTNKKGFLYFTPAFPSYISVIKNYNVGYFNNNIRNNFLFSNPTTTSNPSLSTLASNDTLTFASNFVGTDVIFGLPIYLSIGVWNIEMYTTILTSIVNAYVYLMLTYRNSKNISTIYDSIPHYGFVPTNATQLSIKLTSTLVITNSNTYVVPYLRLLTGCSTPLSFKSINTVTGQSINSASGYNITRIA